MGIGESKTVLECKPATRSADFIIPGRNGIQDPRLVSYHQQLSDLRRGDSVFIQTQRVLAVQSAIDERRGSPYVYCAGGKRSQHSSRQETLLTGLSSFL